MKMASFDLYTCFIQNNEKGLRRIQYLKKMTRLVNYTRILDYIYIDIFFFFPSFSRK